MKKYIIECRDQSGQLDFTDPQPVDVFGMKAITGIDQNQMAAIIFKRLPDATLDGATIPTWPSLIDSRWRARLKTW